MRISTIDYHRACVDFFALVRLHLAFVDALLSKQYAPSRHLILSPIAGKQKALFSSTSIRHVFAAPCRAFAPIYEAWAQEYGGPILFLKANAEIVHDLFEKYRIGAVPTLVIFDNKGTPIRRSAGSEIGKIEKSLLEIKGLESVDLNHFK